ncbi:hypothetical protein QR680_004814 [Steinernema hermaphroditum]|uniref:Dynein light chain n=1 Tax=Steinernema hermaphroditum TaxID=289476 RepID=A0AA39LUL3_9BILA|nr:hypothetical protein QR680_004814 [Steinernema hermaphroditum]
MTVSSPKNKYSLDATELRPMIQKCSMPPEMRDYAMSSTFIQRQMTDDDVARELRSAFDQKFGRGWNVIVGRDFGEFVSHFRQRYIFFYVGRSAIVIYKCPS